MSSPLPPPVPFAGVNAPAAANNEVQCPCCFRAGSLCESYAPEEAEAKINGLKVLMASFGLDALIVPSGDAHSSEYVAGCDERLSWLTGFTGSAGTAVVTSKGEALVWTDGRYFNQAATQLADGPWQLMRQGEPGIPDLASWCAGKRCGIDARLATVGFAKEFEDIVGLETNFVDLIWSKRRPKVPRNPVVPQPLSLTGETVAEKLKRVGLAKGEAMVFNALDQIAWLTNLRGSDIECNPVFFAYAVLYNDKLVLFLRALDEEGSTASLMTHFEAEGCAGMVELRPYSAFSKKSCAGCCEGASKVYLESATTTLAISGGFDKSQIVWVDVSAVERLKARKNHVEIAGLRRAGVVDAIALVSYAAWLASRLAQSEATSEFDGCEELQRRRRLISEDYKFDSFDTISSTGPNSAIIHYAPTKEQNEVIDRSKVYLCDTGAQYTFGTTDVTRTFHFGEPTEDERRWYTRVLQGHLKLATAVFPAGTPGIMLDALARQPLWQDGLNYLHGTGHGVGAYLNVHEGPMGIGGGATAASSIPAGRRQMYMEGIESGHHVSNEPGFYLDGTAGFRIESALLAVTNKDTKYNWGNREWLKFDYLTPVPFERNLIEVGLLSPDERSWIDSHHMKCFKTLIPEIPLLKDPEDAKRATMWLKNATRPL